MNIILELIIILAILVSSIAVVSISGALLLTWLDSKGIIEKITKRLTKIVKKKEVDK